MGRLVQAPRLERVTVPRRGNLEASATVEVPVGGDGFADRIAKYIPGEVIAGYMALDRSLVPSTASFTEKTQQLEKAMQAPASLLEQAGAATSGPPPMSPVWQLALHRNMPLVLLILGLIFTPLYIRQLAVNGAPGTPWRTQALIATLAFFVWAYAIQGSAFTLGPFGALYDGTYASALVIVFTLVSGLFSPAPMSGTSAAASPARDEAGGGRKL